MRLTLCLLTWNELEGCRHDVPLLPLKHFEEVYAIDGGSRDGTVEFLQSQGIKVYSQDLRGYNGAYITAFNKCDTDALVLFHPKGTIDPREVLKFRPLFQQGFDVIVASRMMKTSVNEEDGRFLKPRKWFVLGLAILTSLLWRRQGPMVWDVLHGFRGLRKKSFLESQPLREGLSIDLENVARGYKLKHRMTEFPIAERPRLAGETHFKAFATGRKLLAYVYKEIGREAMTPTAPALQEQSLRS